MMYMILMAKCAPATAAGGAGHPAVSSATMVPAAAAAAAAGATTAVGAPAAASAARPGSAIQRLRAERAAVQQRIAAAGGAEAVSLGMQALRVRESGG